MLTITNDTHIGAIRSTGTTLSSQWELRKYLLQNLADLRPAEGDWMILGDLFDTATVPNIDLLMTFALVKNWLEELQSGKLYLVAGNHDLSKVSTTMSSFGLLSGLLTDERDVVVITEPTMTPHGYVIPHLPNQQMFNDALANMPAEAAGKPLYLHCNYDNFFAVESDQSLNISKEQVSELAVSAVVIAHEHKSRQTGRVYIPGNQVASSCSDWIGQETKFFATVANNVVTLNTLPDTQDYVELDWQALTTADTHKFVRVVGAATTAEASAVVTAISKFRQASQAFVVTNAVRIAAEDGSSATFENALESVHSFSVMAALRELLTADEMLKLESLDA